MWESRSAWWNAVKYAFSKKKTGCAVLAISFVVDMPDEPTTVTEIYTNVTDFQHHLGAELLSFYADNPVTFRKNNVVTLTPTDAFKARQEGKSAPSETVTIKRSYFTIGSKLWHRYQLIDDYEYRTDKEAQQRFTDKMDPNTIAVGLSSEHLFGTKEPPRGM